MKVGSKEKNARRVLPLVVTVGPTLDRNSWHQSGTCEERGCKRPVI